MRKLLPILLSIILSPALAGTITVTSGANDGAGSLRQAIASADPNDIIQFDGTVTTVTLTSELLIDKSLTISGGSGVTLVAAGDPAHRILVVTSGQTVQLSNLTFKNGKAVLGGAMYNLSGQLTVVNCIFEDNIATKQGGAVFNASVPPTFINCLFRGNKILYTNEATDNCPAPTGLQTTAITQQTATLSWNPADGAAEYNIKVRQGATLIRDVQQSATTLNLTGLTANTGYTWTVITICEIDFSAPSATAGFTTSGGGGGGPGGGPLVRTTKGSPGLSDSKPLVEQTTLSSEQDDDVVAAITRSGGTAMANAGGPGPVPINCTFTGQQTEASPGNTLPPYDMGTVLNIGNSQMAVTNCIFWGNQSGADLVNLDGSNPEVTYSIVAGGYSGTGNLDEDPLFVSATDASLQSESPAINSGNNAANDAETDLAGNPRMHGAGIDMGAYEFQGTIVDLPITLNCPEDATIEGCSSTALTASTVSFNLAPTPTAITRAAFEAAGGSIINGNDLASLTYRDEEVAPQQGDPKIKAVVNRIFTATNSEGETFTCTQVITVKDLTPPTLTCPADQTLELGPNCTAQLPDYRLLATYSDNCGQTTVTQVPAPGFQFRRPGNQEVTITVKDQAGLETSCTFTVRIVDNLPPTITCPGNQTLLLDASCSAAVPDYTVLASTDDNCGVSGVSQLPTPGTIVTGPGMLSVTLIVTANHGGARTCLFAVNKVDMTPPTISCPGNQELPLGAGCSAELPDYRSLATASDACGISSVTQIPAPGTVVSGIGTLTVTLTARDISGMEATCSFTVTKVDKTPPTITCPAPITVKCAADVPAPDITSVLATDNCSEVTVNLSHEIIFNQVCANRFTVTRVYKAADANGNSSLCEHTITVNDNVAPVLSAVSVSQPMLWPANHKMRDIQLSYTATDNCGGTPHITVSVSSNEPVNGIGDGNTSPDWEIVNNNLVRLRAERSGTGNGRIYTITVTATDECGNSSTSSAQVVVAHNIIAPVSGRAFKVGSTVDLAGTFWDVAGSRHTARWVIDGSTTVNGRVTAEPSGSRNGTVTGSYKFNSAGVYRLRMEVIDQQGRVTYADANGSVDAIVVIYDPNGGHTYGGGSFQSPAGALRSDPTASGPVSYGFQNNYFKTATNPKGETQFSFLMGDFEFNALNFDYLVVDKHRAQFRGTGRITGMNSGIGFIMSVIDGDISGGGGVDRVRMKIFNRNTGEVYYDNEPAASDAADPSTAVSTGSTVVIMGEETGGGKGKPRAAQIVDTGLRLKVLNNPATGPTAFRIQVLSDDMTSPVNLRLTDASGKILQAYQRVAPGSFLETGHTLTQGTYFAEAVQNRKRITVKLVKM